jgi:hypothetical protein
MGVNLLSAQYNPRMAGSTFQTNFFDLHKLLDDCHRGFFAELGMG